MLVDFPELFLFSATYLAAVFPEARLHWVTEADAGGARGLARRRLRVRAQHRWRHARASLPLDLTGQHGVVPGDDRRAGARLRRHGRARRAVRLLYSLNRERSPYNTELVSVREALAEHYTLTEVPVLDTDYTSATKKPPKPGKAVERIGARLPPPGRPADDADRRRVRGPARRARTPTGAVRAPPRVVLGMTLYNNASAPARGASSRCWRRVRATSCWCCWTMPRPTTPRRSRAATSSATPRVRYERHAQRRAMIATWREVVGARTRARARRREYFAWVSDHDRWHPRWLGRLVGELDADSGGGARLPDHAPHGPGRRGAGQGATAVRHRRLRRSRPRVVAVLPRGRRLGRHGLRADAAGRAAAAGSLPHACCARIGC